MANLGKISGAIFFGLTIFMFFNRPLQAQFALEGTRRPMYAGSWYEADAEKLQTELRGYLAAASPLVDSKSTAPIAGENNPLERPVLAVVVPHAGYMFSGRAAAYAYKAAQGQKVNRVWLLGPSHHVGFHGAALPMAVTFSTPLGDLEVDRAIVDELKGYAMFQKLPEVHRVEHSLEMQLPYIRETFGAVPIVPIVIGSLSDDSEVRMIAEILRGFVGQGDLVVVSSDFTHFGPRYDYQPFKENIRDNIRALDRQAFKHLARLDLDGFIKFQTDTKDTICGFYPCAVLAALLPEGARGTLLSYYTSQDVYKEEKENSVSYLTIAFSGGQWPASPGGSKKASDVIRLGPADREALLKLARGTLETYVRHRRVPAPDELGITVTKPMKQVLGAFVTLNKIPRPGLATNPGAMHAGKELRGCIGYIWPMKPLYQAVFDNTISACSRDHRFESVRVEELTDIRIEISVLTPPRRVSGYKEIALGRDGIVLFRDGRQSVFLPHVPGEFGWGLPETLTQLARKAGLGPDDWKEGAKFDVFQSEIFEEHH